MSLWAAATQIALADEGTEKLRALCWLVVGVQKLPNRWTNDSRLLALDERKERGGDVSVRLVGE